MMTHCLPLHDLILVAIMPPEQLDAIDSINPLFRSWCLTTDEAALCVTQLKYSLIIDEFGSLIWLILRSNKGNERRKKRFEYINTSVEVMKSDVLTSDMTKVGGKCLSTLSTGITQ